MLLRAGFFRSSPDRMKSIADGYAEILKNVNWY